MSDFARRYGPWAVVAGASEGLGAAFARAVAARGLNLVLLARRAAALESLAGELRGRSGVEVRTCAVDLADERFGETVAVALEGLEVGLLVYNAGHSAVGPFLDAPIAEHLRSVHVNVRGPVVLAHALGGAMAQRGRGGIVLMSSLTAFQGSPYVSAYGGTKAFNLAFSEGLWFELRSRGVDVLAVCAGAIRTPNMLAASPEGAPGMVEPEVVAERALSQLGRGAFTIPGRFNWVASFFMRLLPRRMAVAIMGQQTRKLLQGRGAR